MSADLTAELNANFGDNVKQNKAVNDRDNKV